MHQPRRVLVIGLVAQLLDHRQFLRARICSAICSSTRLPDTWYGNAVTTMLPSLDFPGGTRLEGCRLPLS